MGEERAAHCKHTFFILTNFYWSKFYRSCFRMLISALLQSESDRHANGPSYEVLIV